MVDIKMIGGIYEVPKFTTPQNLNYEEKINLLDSGRSCLETILDDMIEKGIEKLFLPDFLCWSSIYKVVESAEVSVELYPVSSFLEIKDTKKNSDSENSGLLLIDYFGLTDFEKNIEKLKAENNDLKIILDLSQNAGRFFSEDPERWEVDYVFCSLRKNYPVISGGALFPKLLKGIDPIQISSGSWQESWLKASSLKDDEGFVDFMSEYKTRIAYSHEVEGIDLQSLEVLRSLDVVEMEKKRRENFEFLADGLKSIDCLKPVRNKVGESSAPLFFPVLIEGNQRDDLRKHLFEASILCPVHWPMEGDPELIGEDAGELYKSELSIVCDHRYGKSDMQRIVDEILNFFEGK